MTPSSMLYGLSSKQMDMRLYEGLKKSAIVLGCDCSRLCLFLSDHSRQVVVTLDK